MKKLPIFTLLTLLFVTSCAPKGTTPATVAPTPVSETAAAASENRADASSEKANNNANLLDFINFYDSQTDTVFANIESSLNYLAGMDVDNRDTCRIFSQASALLFLNLYQSQAAAADLAKQRALYLNLSEMASLGALACRQDNNVPCNKHGLTGCLPTADEATRPAYLSYFLALNEVYKLTGVSTMAILAEELSLASSILNDDGSNPGSSLQNLYQADCQSPASPIIDHICKLF